MKFFFKCCLLIGLIGGSSVLKSHACDRALRTIIDQRSWPLIQKLEQQHKCTTHVKLAKWMALKESFPTVRFEDYQKFIDGNPTWPWQKILIKKAEAIAHTAPAATALRWFQKYPPRSGRGVLAYLNVRHNMHPVTSQVSLTELRQLWIHTHFSDDEMGKFMDIYAHYLRPQDHITKAYDLLNAGETENLKQLYYLLPIDYQTVVDARIALLTSKDDAEIKLALISPQYANDYHVLLDHLHWLRKRKHPHTVEFLFKHRHQLLQAPVRLWKETHVLIRRALEENNYKLALQLVTGHNLKPGVDYVEAEWLRGWLIFKLLKNAKAAQKIFSHLNSVVKTSISAAKTAYWTAVASQVCEPAVAHKWFKRAADYPTTFYGQIALNYLKQPAKLIMMPLPNKNIREQFNSHEFVKVLMILKELRLNDYYRDFLDKLIESVPFDEKILVVQLTKKLDPNYAVRIGRRIKVAKNMIVEDTYPRLASNFKQYTNSVDIGLIHGLIRRESEFDQRIVGLAGEVGLMQIMPETSLMMAKQLGIKYKVRPDLTNPIINVRIGSAYIKQQLQDFDGCLALSLAAYNAGPNAAQRWIEYFGDPRQKNVDMIDWIEMIPYGDTRNYVHRVIENQNVYHIIMNAQKNHSPSKIVLKKKTSTASKINKLKRSRI